MEDSLGENLADEKSEEYADIDVSLCGVVVLETALSQNCHAWGIMAR